MKDKEIVWGSIPIIGLETDEDMKKYTQAYLAKVENGKNHKGKIVSESTRKKIAKNSSKLRHSEQTKEICRQKSIGLNVGRKRTEEERIKISEKAKGRKVSEETKRKMSEKRKGKVISNLTRQKAKQACMRPILYFSLPDMKLIKEYESIISACIDLKRSNSGILKILNGTIKNPRGYTFKYKDIV